MSLLNLRTRQRSTSASGTSNVQHGSSIIGHGSPPPEALVKLASPAIYRTRGALSRGVAVIRRNVPQAQAAVSRLGAAPVNRVQSLPIPPVQIPFLHGGAPVTKNG